MHLGGMQLGCAAIIAFSLLVGQDTPNEDLPSGEMMALVEHVAIVRRMIEVCGRTRPDLFGSLRQAEKGWWGRNVEAQTTMHALLGTAEASRTSQALLAHYAAIHQRLEDELQDAEAAGRNCDWVIEEMKSGRMDYQAPSYSERK
jgi:hypothetical protein